MTIHGHQIPGGGEKVVDTTRSEVEGLVGGGADVLGSCTPDSSAPAHTYERAHTYAPAHTYERAHTYAPAHTYEQALTAVDLSCVTNSTDLPMRCVAHRGRRFKVHIILLCSDSAALAWLRTYVLT